MKPALGSDVEAVVDLKNSDSQPTVIPWSTNQGVIEQNQSPDNLQWETGTFVFLLRNEQGQRVRLKSLTSWLHSSKFASGSQRTIQPGQQVSARVRFRIEDLYKTDPLLLKEGKWQLSAAWVQVDRTARVKECAESNGFFHYDHFYHQENLPMTIQITEPRRAN